MSELKCPHCGQMFTVDDMELNSIINQIRDEEFKKEVSLREKELKEHMDSLHKQELLNVELKLKKDSNDEYEKKIESLQAELQKQKDEVARLNYEIRESENTKKIAVLEALGKVEKEKTELENSLQLEKDKAAAIIKEKDEAIDYYKDFKTRMSTKMVGESLEQHCEILFNQLRSTAFRNAYFEKDNDIKAGSKGDYIYRENDENGVEIISIMFEMKNEMDTTASKHKNEDFFNELDKDRKEKGCEYAILVSMLESDNDLYNTGIVDVSHKYEKMYVVRPQFFIQIISLLRNAAMNSLSYKKELALIKNQNIDISKFEDNLNQFKDAFSRNYSLAHGRFNKAIDEIDKTIDRLQKVKNDLLSSDNQLRLANDRVDDITIKRLTKNNPTMARRFKELKEDN